VFPDTTVSTEQRWPVDSQTSAPRLVQKPSVITVLTKAYHRQLP